MIRKTIQATAVVTIIAVFAIGYSIAYGEESVVQVPFESHGQSCWYDEISVEFHCTWQGIVEKFTIEDLNEFKHILEETVYEEELKRLQEEALAEIAEEKAKLTPNEKIILEIENKLDKGLATATDSVYMNLLKKLSTCEQGMDKRTAPIQTAREFEISDFNLWQVNNVKYEGKLGDIVMAVEECEAQQIIYKMSVGYENMPTGEDDKQFSLLEHYEGVQALPFDQYTRTTTDIDESAICDNNQIPDTHKAQFGCEVLYDGKTIAEIERENQIRFGNDGKIGYQSKVLDDYFEFLKGYGNKQATIVDKALQESIAEPIAKEMIENNHFVQNQIKNDLNRD